MNDFCLTWIANQYDSCDRDSTTILMSYVSRPLRPNASDVQTYPIKSGACRQIKGFAVSVAPI